MKVSGVFCGLRPPWPFIYDRPCAEDVYRTHGPAGSLWCPTHGHVLDVFPPPPLTGVAFLDFTDGTSAAIRLESL